MKPEDIERRSFAIIDAEAGDHGHPAQRWPIVRRMIHTSADFEYITSVRFHPLAVSRGIAAILAGKNIVTDTNMARVGIRSALLKPFGGSVHCLMTDPQVTAGAVGGGRTRAAVAVEATVELMAGGIYVVGNAPTALLRLVELIRDGSASPALVVGLPVGFVKAIESKFALAELDHPYITNVGRKGGSNVAASVVNALALMAEERKKQ
jgi:precorrin-8X/cobalt-precorrin-8 methylmutase